MWARSADPTRGQRPRHPSYSLLCLRGEHGTEEWSGSQLSLLDRSPWWGRPRFVRSIVHGPPGLHGWAAVIWLVASGDTFCGARARGWPPVKGARARLQPKLTDGAPGQRGPRPPTSPRRRGPRRRLGFPAGGLTSVFQGRDACCAPGRPPLCASFSLNSRWGAALGDEGSLFHGGAGAERRPRPWAVPSPGSARPPSRRPDGSGAPTPRRPRPGLVNGSRAGPGQGGGPARPTGSGAGLPGSSPGEAGPRGAERA